MCDDRALSPLEVAEQNLALLQEQLGNGAEVRINRSKRYKTASIVFKAFKATEKDQIDSCIDVCSKGFKEVLKREVDWSKHIGYESNSHKPNRVYKFPLTYFIVKKPTKIKITDIDGTDKGHTLNVFKKSDFEAFLKRKATHASYDAFELLIDTETAKRGAPEIVKQYLELRKAEKQGKNIKELAKTQRAYKELLKSSIDVIPGSIQCLELDKAERVLAEVIQKLKINRDLFLELYKQAGYPPKEGWDDELKDLYNGFINRNVLGCRLNIESATGPKKIFIKYGLFNPRNSKGLNNQKLIEYILRPHVQVFTDVTGKHVEFWTGFKSRVKANKGGFRLIAHNAGYDIPVLENSARESGVFGAVECNFDYKGSTGFLSGYIDFRELGYTKDDRYQYLGDIEDTFLFSRRALVNDSYKFTVPYDMCNVEIEGDQLKYYSEKGGTQEYFPIAKYLDYARKDISGLYIRRLSNRTLKQSCLYALDVDKYIDHKRITTQGHLSMEIFNTVFILSQLSSEQKKYLIAENVSTRGGRDLKKTLLDKYDIETNSIVDFCRYDIRKYIEHDCFPLNKSLHKDVANGSTQMLQKVAEIFTQANMGGFNFNNVLISKAENVLGFDINSSYPHQMIKYGIPVGYPSLENKGEDPVVGYFLKGTEPLEGIEEGRFLTTNDPRTGEAKTSRTPIKSIQLAQAKYIGAFFFKDEGDLYKELCHTKDGKIDKTIYFERSYAAKDMQTILRRVRDAVGKDNEVGKMIKVVMNSLYGKLAEKPIFYSKAYLNGTQVGIDNELEKISNNIAGLYISSRGRVQMLNKVKECIDIGLVPLSGDTDSIKVIGEPNRNDSKIEKIFRPYDKKGIGDGGLDTILKYGIHAPLTKKKYLGLAKYEPQASVAFSGVTSNFKEAISNCCKYYGEGFFKTLAELFNASNNFEVIDGKTQAVKDRYSRTHLISVNVQMNKGLGYITHQLGIEDNGRLNVIELKDGDPILRSHKRFICNIDGARDVNRDNPKVLKEIDALVANMAKVKARLDKEKSKCKGYV